MPYEERAGGPPASRGGLAIDAIDLRKRYKDTVALDGFSLSVTAGTVCGLLGPSGAGKPDIGL